MLHINHAWEPHINKDSQTECCMSTIHHTECCMLTMRGSHTLIKICSYLTQFLKENHQNSTWESLHVSHNIVYSQICHKHNQIMGWKDQTSKKIATCGKFLSAAVVRKQLLGCSSHFLYISFNCNPTAHSLTHMIHKQTQRTARRPAWNMAFHMKQIVGEITV